MKRLVILFALIATVSLTLMTAPAHADGKPTPTCDSTGDQAAYVACLEVQNADLRAQVAELQPVAYQVYPALLTKYDALAAEHVYTLGTLAYANESIDRWMTLSNNQGARVERLRDRLAWKNEQIASLRAKVKALQGLV